MFYKIVVLVGVRVFLLVISIAVRIVNGTGRYLLVVTRTAAQILDGAGLNSWS